MKKVKKVYLINLAQLILQVVFFIWGMYFKSDSQNISASTLGMLTKIQTTSNFQNFFWCFTNNFSVLFIVFWLSYWTFGIIGTLWCANSSFVLGAMVKFSFVIRSWISPCFMLLELIASMFIVIASTYFRIEKFKFKNFCEENQINIDSKRLKIAKRKQEKNMLITMVTVAFILLIAATLETVALNLM